MGERTFKVRLHFTGIEAAEAKRKLQESRHWDNWIVAEQSGKWIALTEVGFITQRVFRKSSDETTCVGHEPRNNLVRRHSCEITSPKLTMKDATDVVVLCNMLESIGAACIESYRIIEIILDRPRRWRRANRDSLVKTLTYGNKLLYTLFAYSPLRQEFCDLASDSYPGWREKINKLATDKWYRKFTVEGLVADNANIASTLHYRGILERCVYFD